MKQEIRQRLEALRSYLKKEAVSAFILPSTDPHMSEYVASHWQSREWISGFTGSAGTVVVTLQEAGLWTDSRYFLQATEQLEGSGIVLYKEGLPETPSIAAFLKEKLQPGASVSIDGKVFSTAEARSLEAELKTAGIALRCMADPMEELWEERPPMPEAPVFVHELQYAGRSTQEKLSDIRQELKNLGAESLLVSALDEIAWTLNLRGSDVHCNPVFISYLLITPTETPA